MFQRHLLAAAVVAMAFGTAQAQTATEAGKSEFFFQPNAGMSAVQVRAGYQMTDTTTKSSGAVQAKESGLNPLSVSYEYGINEMISLGGQLGYQNTTTDLSGGNLPFANPSHKISGLQDPMIMLKGTNVMDFGRIRWGANLGLGLAKQTIETNGNRDAMTGGMSLTPYVGVDFNAGPGLLGARLNYMYNFERTIQNNEGNNGELRVKDGNAFGVAVFYEYMMSDMLLGASYSLQSIAQENVSGSNGASFSGAAYSPMSLDLYARIPVAGFDIVPRLAWGFAAGGDRYDKFQNLNLSVMGRWNF